jgi:hypothetical protein
MKKAPLMLIATAIALQAIAAAPKKAFSARADNVLCEIAMKGASERDRQGMRDFLMKDGAVAAVPGIGALLESLPGQCILFDLCMIGGERGASELTVLVAARKAFARHAVVQASFLETYGALSGGRERLPEEKLANAAVAFRFAMDDGRVRYNENSRNFTRALSESEASCSQAAILLAGCCQSVGLDVAFGYGYYSAAPDAPGHLVVVLLDGWGKVSHVLEPTTYLFGEAGFSEYRVAEMIGMARVALWSRKSELIEENRWLEARMRRDGPAGIEGELLRFRGEVAAIGRLDSLMQNPKDMASMEKGVFSWPMWQGVNAGLYDGWKYEFLACSQFISLYSGEPYSPFGGFRFGR